VLETNKKLLTPMNENDFISTLGQTLEELKITRNALSVEAKVRPATIHDLVNGMAKQINFETLKAIIDALNRISFENGNVRRYVVEDIFTYEPTKKGAQ
jgi:DNA-binding Xre family transcriptional regulator